VLYFHGFPGSGLEAAWAGPLAARLGVQLIGIDRPGYGDSTFQGGRTILGWADDVADLADALAFDTFGVVGMSGGGPYALACALRLPARVTTVQVVSGLGPVSPRGLEPGMARFNQLGLWLGRRSWTGWLLQAGRPLVHHVLTRYPERIVARLRAQGPPRDRDALDALGPVLQESFRRGVRAGARGMVAEAGLFARFSGRWLAEVTTPVEWWHGERDHVVPVSMARRAARVLPDCRPRFFPEDGHFSVVARQMEAVLGDGGSEGV
jgi:pimeloyl-ACP methyl ester carboxylesterase